MKFGFFKKRSGFTLIELLTVMAIIGILSAAMLITLSVYKKRATASKLLLELSSAMQKVYLCISDGNQVARPTDAGGVICQDASGSSLPNYGRWPKLPSGYTYHSSSSFGNSWFYMVTSGDDDLRICCNSTYGKCKKFDSASSPCRASTNLN